MLRPYKSLSLGYRKNNTLNIADIIEKYQIGKNPIICLNGG